MSYQSKPVKGFVIRITIFSKILQHSGKRLKIKNKNRCRNISDQGERIGKSFYVSEGNKQICIHAKSERKGLCLKVFIHANKKNGKKKENKDGKKKGSMC